MTLSQAKKLYIAAGGPSDHSEDEWEDIHKEMLALVAATSDRSAGKIIEWWGCWERRRTATGFARKVRDEWAKIRK